MGLLDQLDLDAVKRLYRADLPVPVDVLNLIHFKDENAYKWYGVLTLPLLKAVGAQVGWMGAHVESFVGEPRAEELLVVRYPNQRRFFALALNPYYMLVANPQRIKAVRKFEASFTHSPDSLDVLRGSKWVLAVHFHEAPDAIQDIVETAGGQLVYHAPRDPPDVSGFAATTSIMRTWGGFRGAFLGGLGLPLEDFVRDFRLELERAVEFDSLFVTERLHG
jgi:uncharacterized protein (DUF1330 family)